MTRLPPVWVCKPNLPRCRSGHLFLTYKINNGAAFEWRGDMHLYLTCPTCGDHAFGVLHVRPSPLLHLYHVDKAQFKRIKEFDDDVMSWEILCYLGYATEEGVA